MLLKLGVACATITVVRATNAGEAISREISVNNDLVNPVVNEEAISRELSVQNNSFPCCGNLTDDGQVMIDDIPTFVDVLTGIITDGMRRDAADINCDGNNDAKDIQPFVDRILSGYSCQ